jgi:TolB protein
MTRLPLLGLALLTAALLCVSCTAGRDGAATQPAGRLGLFDAATDVGLVAPPGVTEFLGGQRYRLSGGGANIWGTADAFQFAYRQAAGDLTLTAAVEWVGVGHNAQRKAGWMVRLGLAADAPYADVAIHGDGTIALQYRATAGGVTQEVKCPVRAPAAVRLQRRGDRFSLAVARPGGAFEPAGEITLALPDPVCVGLFVSAHDATVTETAEFTGVTWGK